MFPLDSKVNDLSIKSVSMIFANEISGAYKDGDKITTLQGNSIYYTEQLADFKFTVSPFSFF